MFHLGVGGGGGRTAAITGYRSKKRTMSSVLCVTKAQRYTVTFCHMFEGDVMCELT